MTTTIWKFPILVHDDQSIEMPRGADILWVDNQQGQPCIWARVNPYAPKEQRRIRIFGTGHPMPDELGDYVGTFMMKDGALVFHLYEAD